MSGYGHVLQLQGRFDLGCGCGACQNPRADLLETFLILRAHQELMVAPGNHIKRLVDAAGVFDERLVATQGGDTVCIPVQAKNWQCESLVVGFQAFHGGLHLPGSFHRDVGVADELVRCVGLAYLRNHAHYHKQCR